MTETRLDGERHERVIRRWKLIGTACAAVPFTMVLVFAIAEGTGLEPGWWGHLIQLAIVLLLAAVAWRWPVVGGPLLVLIGGAFAVLMFSEANESLLTQLPAVAIIAVPLAMAGIFFTLAGFSDSARREG